MHDGNEPSDVTDSPAEELLAGREPPGGEYSAADGGRSRTKVEGDRDRAQPPDAFGNLQKSPMLPVTFIPHLTTKREPCVPSAPSFGRARLGRAVWGAFAFVALCGASTLGCDGKRGPQVGSQTNWFVECSTSAQCGDGLACECGHCTVRCDDALGCGDLPGATCIAEANPSAVAVCGGYVAPAGLCLPTCGAAGDCPEGASCVAGVCMPSGPEDATLSLDLETQHQTLIGFGAGVGFTEDAIVEHPARDALLEALYGELGLDALRLRNRYEGDNDDDLLVTAELVSAIEDALGRTPTILINASSPPGALKENGSRTCAGNPDTCVLRRNDDGDFDYAALGDYWRASFDAYTAAGVPLHYLSVQNNPNIVPAAGNPAESCFFLPEEGTTTVTIDGTDVTVDVPGYREAVAAVRSALADAPNAPQVMGPDTPGFSGAQDYAAVLSATEHDALSVHIYGLTRASDTAGFEAIGELARARNQPVLQSEAAAEALDSAVLIHHALVRANASAYLQNELAAASESAAPVSLALMTEDSFERQLPFYTFAHYAQYTDPGWVRVEIRTTAEPPLVSAWMAPDEQALAIVLVNPTDQDARAYLELPADFAGDGVTSRVVRTVFDGVERTAELGPFPSDGSVRLPARSMATVAFSRE